MKFTKRLSFGVVFLLLSTTLLSQDQQTNLNKYWHYRYRLVNYYLVVGNGPGQSCPAGVRDDAAGTLGWGDGPVYLGYYIGVLATEYKLLTACNSNHINDQALDINQTELYYALKAAQRLDLEADGQFGPTYNISNLNGLMLRDDVDGPSFMSANYTSLNKNLSNTGITAGSGAPGLVNQATSDLTSYNTSINFGSPGTCTTHLFASQDNLYQLLMGLALVVKCVDPGMHTFVDNTQQPNYVNISFDFSGNAREMADIYLGYMKNGFNNHPWFLGFPNGNDMCLRDGGVMLPLYPTGAAAAGTFITGNNYIDGINSFPNNVSAWEHTATDVLLRNNPSNILMPLTLAALGDSWFDILGNNSTKSGIQFQGDYSGDHHWPNDYYDNHCGMDQFYGTLHRFLHGYSPFDPPALDFCYIENNILNTAPPEGPFYHGSLNDAAPDGWRSSWRFYSNPPEAHSGGLPGNYNGLDYMLMHNLYYCLRLDEKQDISGTFPDNSTGNLIHPTWIGAHIISPQVYFNPTNAIYANNLEILNLPAITNTQGPVGDVSIIGGVSGVRLTNTQVRNGAYFHSIGFPTSCTYDVNNFIFQPNHYKSMSSKSSHDTISYTPNDEFKSIGNDLYSLYNYPNPATTETTFEFDVKDATVATLMIFDIHGDRVRTIFENKHFEKGKAVITYNISDLSEGMYFYTLTRGSERITRKLIIQR